MENLIINIVNVVGDSFCVAAEDGQKVFVLLKKAFAEDKKVTLSFVNVTMLTTAFLNTAIGQLYREYGEQFIKDHLKVDEMNQSGLVSLKRVVDTAKLFYNNQDSLQKSIDDILED